MKMRVRMVSMATVARDTVVMVARDSGGVVAWDTVVMVALSISEKQHPNLFTT